METPSPSPAPAPPASKSGSAFGLVLTALLPAGLAAQWARPLAGLLWTEIFVFLLPAAIAAAGAGLDGGAWLRLRRPAPAALALGVVAGAAGWFTGSALFAVARALAPVRWVQQFDLGRLFEGAPLEQGAFAAAAVVVAPICEEVAFRGHLAAAFHSRHRPVVAVAASAVFFALLHLDPIRAPSLVLLGALYGWIAWRTGSLWPAVAAHATNNGIATALALWAGSPGAAEGPPLRVALAGLVAGAVALAVSVGLFRGAVPIPPAGLAAPPVADPRDPSVRFRLHRVPAPLLATAVAGWVTLGALLMIK